MTATFAHQFSAYPFMQPVLLPLSQSNSHWDFNPTLRDSVTWTDHFMKWRHNLPSQSWGLPSPSCPTLGSLPSMFVPELIHPPSPSDSCSSVSVQTPPPSQVIEVVCNVPLVVPKPRPFKRITPLDFELPSEDQDLSHPPYTTRSSSKRKHSQDEDVIHDRSKRTTVSPPSVAVTRPSKMMYPRFRNVPSKPR